eukprot:1883176-Pyramimonas_sp.AAC.1
MSPTIGECGILPNETSCAVHNRRVGLVSVDLSPRDSRSCCLELGDADFGRGRPNSCSTGH